MESTIGHCFGFMYTSILMIQGSLFNTTIHTNKTWKLICEVFVGFHGGIVAIQTAGMTLWVKILILKNSQCLFLDF